MALASDVPNPDDTLWVKFEKRAVQNSFRSEQEGRPCFDDVVFVSIIAPGDQNNKVDRPAHEGDKQRFPRQWANFERGDSEKIDGMPIEEWAAITRSQAEELKYAGVRTVEQLCAASDGQMQKIMGGVSLRERAKAFLADAKKGAEAQRIAAENQELRDRISMLEAQIKQIGALQKPSADQPVSDIPKRRGRPPKIQTPVAA